MDHAIVYVIFGFAAYGFGTFVGNVGDMIQRRIERGRKERPDRPLPGNPD